MMSKLPDEVWVSIMCLLTMEEAATMRLVSRRWQKIWKITIQITPSLTFNFNNKRIELAEGCAKRDLINEKINAVNKVVKLHRATTLDEFVLIASTLHSREHHHINAWMDFAAKKNVKKLTLLVPWYYKDVAFVADNFHSLRDLNIEQVDVTENLIHRMFSNSPFVERFSLKKSRTIQELKIAASVPNLKYLELHGCDDLRHLEISSSSSAHNLNTMKITDMLGLQSLSISSVPNLSHLILGIHSQGFKFDTFFTLLNQITTLTLVIEVFNELMLDQFPQFPQFSKVKHLELKMLLPCFYIPIHRLPAFLKAAPLLNTFTVQFGYCFGHPAKRNALKWLNNHIPKKVEVNQKHSCQHLKVVKLDIFAGCQYEVEFVLHLLKYAVSVKKIIIHLMPSSIWRCKTRWVDYENKFDNQYEELCLRCARVLKAKIGQMHSTADVIII